MNTSTLYLGPTAKLLIAALAIALMALHPIASPAADAQQPSTRVLDQRTEVVSLADLDISTAQGAQAAEERLRKTARRLCAQVQDPLDLGRAQHLLACVEETFVTALRAMNGAAPAQNPKSQPPGVYASARNAPAPANPLRSRSMTVSLAGLDLATPSGAQVARERIHQAARRLCAEVGDSFDLGRPQHFVACVDDTVAAALPQIKGLAVATIAARTAENTTP